MSYNPRFNCENAPLCNVMIVINSETTKFCIVIVLSGMVTEKQSGRKKTKKKNIPQVVIFAGTVLWPLSVSHVG